MLLRTAQGLQCGLDLDQRDVAVARNDLQDRGAMPLQFLRALVDAAAARVEQRLTCIGKLSYDENIRETFADIEPSCELATGAVACLSAGNGND